QNPKSEIQNQNDADPAHLDRAIQRSYVNFVCREAIRQFETDRVTTTTKTGTRGDKTIDETTQRREPQSLQCLQIILQAVNVGQAPPTPTNPKRQRGMSSSDSSPTA